METESAEKNLEVIRKLMERSSVYRLISSYSAMVGGILSLGVGTLLYWRGEAFSPSRFFWIWMGVLLVVDGTNTFLLFRDAKRKGNEFPSRRMLHAIKVMLPGFLVGGIFSVAGIFLYEDPVFAVVFWSVGCGLALLGTSSFSPRSIPVLGWFFLLAGLACFCWEEATGQGRVGTGVAEAGLFMALTFGMGLLVYGVSTRQKKIS